MAGDDDNPKGGGKGLRGRLRGLSLGEAAELLVLARDRIDTFISGDLKADLLHARDDHERAIVVAFSQLCGRLDSVLLHPEGPTRRAGAQAAALDGIAVPAAAAGVWGAHTLSYLLSTSGSSPFPSTIG